jgi:hypothetical protein
VSLPNSLGLRWSISRKASVPPSSKAAWTLSGREECLRSASSMPPLVEALYGCARRLGIAAQLAGYGIGVLAPGAGKEDLATTEDEGVGRAQAVLQDLALRVQKRTHEDRSSHGDQRSTLQTTCSENALEGKFSEVDMQHPALPRPVGCLVSPLGEVSDCALPTTCRVAP